ncbi:MAG: aspartate 1-decarboxylase [candidate division Zixibacteria bacterium]|nr:aspartate 1-decarboxylase [candidate division Zixibacteria bacterium]MBU1469503.1 aspartate 1-decarboxylase [candidate division Zixibacteria bacterium]MBU2625570.1 aspartate 1-decarboxylase [candidate division Zixibacteria bacterium]
MDSKNYINMCRAKIHRATVTEANLEYEGSITIDEELMEASGMFEYEQVHVLNLSTGSRIETYTIRGERNSGTICLNGAAARLGSKGDEVIIIAYTLVPQENASGFRPRIVLVDKNNRITNVK